MVNTSPIGSTSENSANGQSGTPVLIPVQNPAITDAREIFKNILKGNTTTADDGTPLDPTQEKLVEQFIKGLSNSIVTQIAQGSKQFYEDNKNDSDISGEDL